MLYMHLELTPTETLTAPATYNEEHGSNIYEIFQFQIEPISKSHIISDSCLGSMTLPPSLLLL